MAAEMVNMATSDKLKEMDWGKSIEICELVARDHGQAKGVIKAIKKRLGSKNANNQLYAVMLLEMLTNNCGEHIHKQVIDNGLLPVLVKIVKKKTDLPVRERIFLLLDAIQTALGGASGKFPQYYAAYYDLVSARVQFPQHPRAPPPEPPALKSQTKDLPAQEPLPHNGGGDEKQPTGQIVSDSSIMQKGTSVLEVLREVLNAMNPKCPEGAADEFVLDLVEQCSFQKQRVMHLVMTSRDETVVTQAIDLNEQLHKLLAQHDAFLSVRPDSSTPLVSNEEEEDEDEEHLYLRIRKGKACVQDDSDVTPASLRSIPEDKMRRPLIRPLSIQPTEPNSGHPPPAVSIPPPPAKPSERERFFKEKHVNGMGMAGHMRELSLHSRDGSSSYSGSTDFSDRDFNGFRD